MSEENKRAQARKTCIYAFLILTVFMLLGNGIISLFGISLAGIRVAGGIIIMILALRMIFSGEDTSSQVDADPADIKKADLDYSFSPLAMPSLAGPGSIAVVMGFSSQIPAGHNVFGHVVITIGISIMVVVAYIALLSSNWIEKFLGDHGMQAVTKIMGFLLTCLAVQFLASGISEFITQFGKHQI
jgi:multiple antibiotic resistance protein